MERSVILMGVEGSYKRPIRVVRKPARSDPDGKNVQDAVETFSIVSNSSPPLLHWCDRLGPV